MAEPSPRQHAYHPDLEYYGERALGLLASAEDGTPGARAAFERHGQQLTPEGARTVVAREHGSTSWEQLREQLGGLVDAPFARAFRLIEARDVDGLATLVDQFPELVSLVGTNGNDLLGLAGATCDERLSRVLLSGAPIPRGATHTAGPRCTKPPTATCRCSPTFCSPPARRSMSRAAATAGPRWSSRCSGGTRRWPKS